MLAVGTSLLLASATQAVTDNSDDYQKGLTFYHLGDYQRALAHFQDAIDDDPSSWSAYEQEGYCYFHLGKKEKMKLAFFESLKIHPENPGLKAFISRLPGKLKTLSNTPVPPLTSVPTCSGTSAIIYSDSFSSSSTLSNYEYVNKFTTGKATVQITGGELLVTAGSGLSGVMILVKDNILSHSLSNYTLDFDAKMNQLNGHGVFGPTFRGKISSPNMNYNMFIWNGNPENTPPHWQVFNVSGNAGSNYQYLGGSRFGSGLSSPSYTPNNWMHFTVICQNNHLACYVDVGSGRVLLYNFLDSSFPKGGVGFEASFIQSPNQVHFKNLVVKTCL